MKKQELDTLECPRCSKFLREPVQLITCGCRFCTVCMDSMLANETKKSEEESFMKKLVEKDKKVRKKIKKLEKKKFILKIILNNINLPYLLRFNASNNLNSITKKASKTFISNRCITTVNKKKFG